MYYLAQKKELCAIKTGHIDNEINISLKQIVTHKQMAISAIKVYLIVLSSIFVFAAHVNGVTAVAAKHDSVYMLYYSIFGALALVIVFIIGWAALYFITGCVVATILDMKHIGYMRGLKSSVIGNTFVKSCIFPVSKKRALLRRSQTLPVVFSLINLVLLIGAYYFWSLYFSQFISVTLTLIPLVPLAIYYPNVCIKYYEEVEIAQRITPRLGDDKIRYAVKKMVRSKNNDNKTTGNILRVVAIVLIFSFLLNFIVNIIDMSKYIDYTYIEAYEVIILIVVIAIKYWLAKYRVDFIVKKRG